MLPCSLPSEAVITEAGRGLPFEVVNVIVLDATPIPAAELSASLPVTVAFYQMVS